MLAGCEILAAADRDRISVGEGVAAGAGRGAGEGGAGGIGAGGAAGSQSFECLQASDCPDPGNECLLRACDAVTRTCKPAMVGDLFPVTRQVPMDCKKIVCDGKGGTKQIDDSTDVPEDGNDCTEDVCAAFGPLNAISPPGKACDDDGGKACDGAGACVECVTDEDCAGGVCEPLSKTCVPPTCADGVLDGDETDVDCGNSCGPTCAPGRACDDRSDSAPPGIDCIGSVCT